jgi:hypothetical protein|tara:strand:- start:97 stop:456 length:360 start_codon:yes stop_codon:yes gene_type:complete
MPTYTIENTEEDEIYDTVCSWNELQTFLSENPQYKKVVTAPAIVGGIEGKTHKTDDGFKENMSRIAEAHPNSPMAERYGHGKNIAETRVRNVAKKHKLLDVTGQNVNKHYTKNKSTGLY